MGGLDAALADGTVAKLADILLSAAGIVGALWFVARWNPQRE